MNHTKQSLIDLLSSLSGILVFLAIAHLITVTGLLQKFTPYLIAVGLIFLFWPRKIDSITPNFIKLSMITMTSHILLFVGLHVYLSRFINDYWWLFLVIGFVFLTYNRAIAGFLFKDED